MWLKILRFPRSRLEAIVAELKEKQGINLKDDLAALQRLKDGVEDAKHQLSSLLTAKISLPFIGVTSKGPIHLECEVSRQRFESLTRPLLDRLERPCRQALEDTKLSSDQIDQVVLVGGMTRMPAVQEKVVSIFGKPPSKGVNPDEIVAIGAATQSAIMKGEVREVILLDVTSHSLGIRVEGDRFSPIIRRNTTIPIRESKVFATTEDNQEVVVIEVYQGDDPKVRNNRLLGRFELGDLGRAPAGAIQVQVSFGLDSDGILHVDATETRSGRATSKKILASSGLSADEVSRLSAVYATP
jgi:molecular chaperone DnaK